MRKYLDVIKSSRLFRDIDDGEIEAMLACLSVSSREYAKNEFILRAGERSSSIGLVLAGAVHIIIFSATATSSRRRSPARYSPKATPASPARRSASARRRRSAAR